MSGFCGFIGKTDKESIENMTKTLDKNCGQAPVCFSDGYIHLGFVSYVTSEMNEIGHNENFTIWAMIDCDRCTGNFKVENFIEQYERNGLSFLKELEGTFSAVLWDGIQKRLYLIRDRYGAKPLFYEKNAEGIVFASELKTILSKENPKRKINTAALYQYFSHQSIYLPNTAFEGVYHVTPGCYGLYSGGAYEEIPYVDVEFEKVCDDGYEEAADKIYTLLAKSVERCTDDENAGIFLSGGLDSSLIAGMARRGTLKHAFCLKPVTGKNSIHKKDEDVFYSAMLAKEYGLIHHVVEMKPQDLIENTDEIIKNFSQPFSGTVSTHFLAKEASKICRKIITGDGADELFGSYRHHSVTIPLEKYALLRERGETTIGRETEFSPYEAMIPFLDSMYCYGEKNDTLWYYRLLQMGDGEKSIFLNSDIFGDLMENQSTLIECVHWDKELRSRGVLNRSLERDFKHLLPGYTMLYSDTLARNQGINLAMPFMNNELTNYVVSLPQEYKIKEGMTKAVLRKAGEKVLPDRIVQRRKEPFSLPITEWLKTDLKEYLTDILCEDAVKRNGFLKADCVRYAMEEFYKYPDVKGYYGGMLWTMAMLQKWATLYI